MVEFSKEIQDKILAILKKFEYKEKEHEILDYDFEGDEVVFSISINNSKMIPVEDLMEIGELIGGCFKKITVVNEQYRFYYTYNPDKCVCEM